MHKIPLSTDALGGETAILSNKSGEDFCCLYHVGTRLEDLENTISPPKSLVPLYPIYAARFC